MKILSDEEWIKEFKNASGNWERNVSEWLDEENFEGEKTNQIIDYRIGEVAPRVARQIFEYCWNPSDGLEWDGTTNLVVINNFEEYGRVYGQVKVSQQDYQSVALEIYQQVFADDSIHSEVEGIKPELSRNLTLEKLQMWYEEGYWPQQARKLTENGWEV